MRILVVGSYFNYAIERHFIKYLEAHGAIVSVFNAPDRVAEAVSKSLLRRVLFRARLKTGYRKINKDLLEEVRKSGPDIVWVFKGMEIYPKTLAMLKKTGVTLVNYNPDHPFIISGRGSGNSNVTRAVKLYDLHFSYHGILQQQISSRYKIPVVFLPFGYELTEAGYREAARQEEIKKVCLIGSPDATRIRLISSIAREGIAVDIYGNRWSRSMFSKYPNVTVYPAVLEQEFWNRLRQYRVQLNIFRKHNIGSHNMRSIEVPAVGGILLTPFSEEQAGFFEEGKEIFFYYNEDDLLLKIRTILSMSTEEINRVRENARQRSLASGYSYAARVKTVFETFQQLNTIKE